MIYELKQLRWMRLIKKKKENLSSISITNISFFFFFFFSKNEPIISSFCIFDHDVFLKRLYTVLKRKR